MAVGIFLLLCTVSRLYSGHSNSLGVLATSRSSLSYSRPDVYGQQPKSRYSASRLRPADLQKSSTPRRLRPSGQRLSILQSIVSSRRSSYSSTSFFSSRTGSDAIPSTSSPPLAHQLVSAIIVHEPDWHLDNTQLVVNLVSRYPFVREILLWNNDLDLQIDGQTISLPTLSELGFEPPRLRVLNAPSSFSPLAAPIHRTLPASHAKHLACSLSNHEICLFLSPSFLPIHLDSLYASYLASGPAYNQIVSIVNAEDYHRLQHLVFQNEAVDLHTAALFPALATSLDEPRRDMQETIVRKEHSRRFWKQLGTLTADVTDEADIYWSLWMNTIPNLLVAPSLPFVETLAEPTPDDKAYQTSFILDALRSLYTVLTAQDPFMSPDPFPLAPSPPTSDARAPSHDDRCTFITNMSPYKIQASELPFQAPSSRHKKGKTGSKGFFGAIFGSKSKAEVKVQDKAAKAAMVNQAIAGIGKKAPFDPYTSISSIEEYEDLWLSAAASASTSADSNIVLFPKTKADFKYSLSWYPAVNGRHPTSSNSANATCWTSPSPPLKEDFFGLGFVQPLDLQGSTISLLGSKVLGNIVGIGEEDLTAESWEIWTQAPSTVAVESKANSIQPLVWTRRKLEGNVESVGIGEGPYWRHTFELASIMQSIGRQIARVGIEDETGDSEEFRVLKKRKLADAYEEEEDTGLDEKDVQAPRQVQRSPKISPEVHAIKLVSSDRKNQRIRVCGWQIDDWII